jgi:N-acetylmuramoyl-L-alanine amidase
MYPFNDKVWTTKKSKWINACTGIVIHHTAWWTYKSNMKYLSEWTSKASVHFVIGENGEVWKIWDPKDILWHAWNWSWWGCENVNTKFLWIEVVGYWAFNIHQLGRLTDLVEYLMWNFPIDRENIIRHSDCTQERWVTKQRILWNWLRKVKKRDIWIDFFYCNDNFKIWREQLKPRKESLYK